MTPQELGTIIDSHLSMFFGQDSMIDVNGVVDAVMNKLPVGETVDRDTVHQRVMERGIGRSGMRW